MLSRVNAAGSGIARQIVALGNNSGVMYTVPAGRTFTGLISKQGTSGSVFVNGVTVNIGTSGDMSVTLLGDTVVSWASGTMAIIGVEQ